MSSGSAPSALSVPTSTGSNRNNDNGNRFGNDPDKGRHLHGTKSDDLVVGTDGNDTIVGRNGNDTLDGADGDDFIAGGNDIRMKSTSGICPSACSARSGGAPRRSLTPSASAAPS